MKTLNTLVLRARVTQTTVADYCQDRIGRKTAESAMRRAGWTEEGLKNVLDAADRNLILKANYRERSRQEEERLEGVRP